MDGYPNTYNPDAIGQPETNRPKLFEPALRQFRHAFRAGDPIFQDPQMRQEWYAARRRVMEHILTLITTSHWNEHLVLRGSLLMQAWFGDEAREPGDIDWVFRPASVAKTDPMAQSLFDELIQLIAENRHVDYTVIETDRIRVDEIWTYERAQGRRIVFPWILAGLPAGEVQMDIVFREQLFIEPIVTRIPTLSGNGISVWSATPELSLAWKLAWLESDVYAQGKDLYDATLLAERTQVSADLLLHVLGDPEPQYGIYPLPPYFPNEAYVDWADFQREYPWVQGDVQDWYLRLAQALPSTLSTRNTRQA